MKWRIGHKLTIASLLMIVLTLLAGGVGLWQVLAIEQAVTAVREAEQQRAWALELSASGHRLVASLDHLFLEREPGITTKEVMPAVSLVGFYVYLLQTSGVELEIPDLIDEMQVASDELRQTVNEVELLARQELWEEVSVSLEREVRPANQRMGVLIERLVFRANQHAEQATLRAEQVARQAVFLLVTLAVLTTGIAISWRQVIFRQLGQSIALLRWGVARISGGELDYELKIRTGDEIEELADEFNEMAHSLQASQARLERWGQDLEVSVAERTQELQQALEEQRRLWAAIREMSTPVVPVHSGIIVMPLVGVIDAQRARQIVTGLLAGVESHDAHVAIVDVTGIPMMSHEVVGYLMEAAQAVRLLGAEVVLVGITPEVAKTIIELGIDLAAGLITRSDLQAGLEYALGTMNLYVTGNGA